MPAVSTPATPNLNESPWRVLTRDIKLSHSVFALPFAVLAAFMARPLESSATRFSVQLGLIVICMVTARTAAMIANRLIDRDIDARNPRTAGRALPSRRVRVKDAVGVGLLSAGAFIATCAVFGFAFDNWWPFLLSAPVLIWISAYPWLKRFTVLCHLYLGASLAISPLAAAIAVDPSALSAQPSLWLLSLNVICWVAGFDIIYALQDLEIDRTQGLYSMPGRFGARRALWISRLLHFVSAAALVAIGWTDPRFAIWFALAVGVVVVLLVVEHALVAGGATARVQIAFFTMNGLVSVLVGVVGIASVVASWNTG
ncbi:MAG: 4-hydroxybenzoate octaprenyltransferase [Phycisphaerales bacterium]